MKKYNRLLTNISQKYNIVQGATESEVDWKIRIIYSICGMMAYSSLWDDESPISITHFKKRIIDILESYRELYPEITKELPKPDELANELLNIFQNTGVVYHSSGHVTVSIQREAKQGDIVLQRGIEPDSIHCVSGSGFYNTEETTNCSDHVRQMFGLEEKNLLSCWEDMLSSASMYVASEFDSMTEYLKTEPPFSRGYWSNIPDKSGLVSILRVGMNGSQLYYLYRYIKGNLEVSPLQYWQVDRYNYRTLANACLSARGNLPPIEYFCDGGLVHISIGYLPPPRELEFIKLYSWPETCITLPCNFNRKCSLPVFLAFQSIFTEEGYSFKER